MKCKVIILRGLPASGKTSWAKEMLEKHPGQYKRINKDDLRDMLDGGRWSKHNEKFILHIRDQLIITAMKEGFSVIVDDTNFEPKHEDRIREILEGDACGFGTTGGFKIEVKFFDTPLEECIERDLKRTRSVGERVIRRMYNKYLRSDKPIVYIPPEGKPKAIIVDIDGTLAIHGDRSPYDWHRVFEDEPNRVIASIIRSYIPISKKIILVSGRDEICRAETEKWLSHHYIPYQALFMRPMGNTEKDAIIKRRIFDEHIRDHYQIQFVLDDRNQVVEMWRKLGLMCLQVAEGDF